MFDNVGFMHLVADYINLELSLSNSPTLWTREGGVYPPQPSPAK